MRTAGTTFASSGARLLVGLAAGSLAICAAGDASSWISPQSGASVSNAGLSYGTAQTPLAGHAPPASTA